VGRLSWDRCAGIGWEGVNSSLGGDGAENEARGGGCRRCLEPSQEVLKREDVWRREQPAWGGGEGTPRAGLHSSYPPSPPVPRVLFL
jgi:hypothetical protein